MPTVVTVCSRWGDYVLGVQDVRPGQNLQRPPVSFTAGEPQVAGQLLRDGETVTLESDGVTFEVSYQRTEPVPRTLPKPWLALGAVTVLGVAVLGGSAELWHEMQAALRGMTSRAVAPPSPLPEPALDTPHIITVSSEREPDLAVPGKMRCGDAEMGALDTPEPNARYGVRGPSDNADPHLAKKATWTGSSPSSNRVFGIGIALEPVDGTRAPTAPWGRDAQLGTDATDALGQMWGDDFGIATGELGLGRQAEPGGVAKELQVTATRAAQPRLLHAGLRVTGRKPSEVARELATQFPVFQRCAETFAPAAAREVRLTFDIGASGHVVAAEPADALSGCLLRGVRQARFTQGQPAHVVYPLHVLPAGAELRVAPSQAASNSCHCG